jgi:hypothetical protein
MKRTIALSDRYMLDAHALWVERLGVLDPLVSDIYMMWSGMLSLDASAQIDTAYIQSFSKDHIVQWHYLITRRTDERIRQLIPHTGHLTISSTSVSSASSILPYIYNAAPIGWWVLLGLVAWVVPSSLQQAIYILLMLWLVVTIVYYIYRWWRYVYRYMTRTSMVIGDIHLIYTDASDVLSISDRYIELCREIMTTNPGTIIHIRDGVIYFKHPIDTLHVADTGYLHQCLDQIVDIAHRIVSV